ncbi:hypothetical protein S40288_09992 [Stachybotrys chartarum IBT 40288]|nr:hypothetical protein S40288_09992 [Stachybotrys chartarum IBT 40288]
MSRARLSRRKVLQNVTSPLPLAGCVIALSGRFQGYSQGSVEDLIQSLGGSAKKNVTKSTTHVVCTEKSYASNITKVAAGKKNKLPLLSLQWILDSDKQKARADERGYLWSGASGATAATAPIHHPHQGKERAHVTVRGQVQPPRPKEHSPVRVMTRRRGTTGHKTKANDSSSQPQPPTAGKLDRVTEGQVVKEKKAVVVPRDEHCDLINYKVYIDPESGTIYDANLNQSHSSLNRNKFYRIQASLLTTSAIPFATWTRWGRVGYPGQHATLLSDGAYESAKAAFEKKFRDKSGLSWDQRDNSPKPGKYVFIERNYYDSDDDAKDPGAFSSQPNTSSSVRTRENSIPKCTLDEPVKQLMELIFNQNHFKATMKALNYDSEKLPLGKLSTTTIKRGFQQLKELAALIDDDASSATQAKEHLSNIYYSVIPHAFGQDRPPVICNNEMLQREIKLLESLSDMKYAADMMNMGRKTVHSMHPLDIQFRGLHLTEMTALDHDSNEFKVLTEYLHGSRAATHKVRYDVQNVFRIERDGEKARFDKLSFASTSSNRRLLWHGSRCANFAGILSQGLRIAPPEAPVSGYMFGKGIYLADMSSKSASYCATQESNGHALLLLCEAELGDPMYKLTNASYHAGREAEQNGRISTWGQGRIGPARWIDAGVAHKSLNGIKMPDTSTNGRTKVRQKSSSSLFYNEYICYNVDQVRLWYLFLVKM